MSAATTTWEKHLISGNFAMPHLELSPLVPTCDQQRDSGVKGSHERRHPEADAGRPRDVEITRRRMLAVAGGPRRTGGSPTCRGSGANTGRPNRTEE